MASEIMSSRVVKIEYTVWRVTPAARAAAAMVTSSKPPSAMSPSVASRIFCFERMVRV